MTQSRQQFFLRQEAIEHSQLLLADAAKRAQFNLGNWLILVMALNPFVFWMLPTPSS